MRTEASGKFEKNLDPMMTVPAVQRACELVELLECGDVLDGIIDVINYVPEAKTLPLEVDKVNRLLGTDISKEEMVRYLNLLEVPVEGDTILVPSFRPDLNLMADIAEEVGRSYGYNEIPTTAFRTSTQGGYSPEMKLEAKEAELKEKGYTLPEYAFVVECGGATSGESGVLEVRGGLRVVLKNQETHEILGNKRISLWREDEKILETRTDSEGYFEVIGIGIGEFTVTVEEE